MSTRPAHRALQGAALALALAACAGGNHRPARREIRIEAFAFFPAREPATPGDTLVFVNADAVPHTATADDGSWDTGVINAGETHTVVVPANGVGAYKCALHPTMKGTLAKAE